MYSYDFSIVLYIIEKTSIKAETMFKQRRFVFVPKRLQAQNGSGPLLTHFSVVQPTLVKLCVCPFTPVGCRNVKPTSLKEQKVKILPEKERGE